MNSDDLMDAVAGWSYSRYRREDHIKTALITFITQNPERETSGRHSTLTNDVEIEIVDLDDSDGDQDGTAELEPRDAVVVPACQRSASPAKQITSQDKGKQRGKHDILYSRYPPMLTSVK